MPSRANRLLAAVLDRVVPPRRRRTDRSYAWEPGSQWSGDWRSPDGRVHRSAAPPGPPEAPTSVGVTVEGPIWDPTDPVVEGEIEPDEPDDAATATAEPAAAPAGGAASATAPSGAAGPGTTAPGTKTAGSTTAGTTTAGSTRTATVTDAGHPRRGAPDAATPAEQAGPAAPPRPRRLRDEAVWGGAIAVAVVLLLALVVNYRTIGDWLVAQRVEQAARSFATAWQDGDLGRVTYDPSSGARDAGAGEISGVVADRARAATAGLTTRGTDAPSEVELVGPVAVAAGRTGGDRTATQQLRVRWLLDHGRAWTYTTTLGLRERGNRWRVVWTPQTVHPALRPGEGLVEQRVQPPRAQILAADGSPLVRTGTVYRVTFSSDSLIRPYGDLQRLAGLVGMTGTERERFVDRATSVKRGTTVQVAMVPQDRWKRVGRDVLAIDGAAADRLVLPLRRTGSYGGEPLGEVLPATPAMAEASKGRLLVGDLTGTSGLQRTYDDRLRGTPGLRVVALPLPRADRALTPYAVAADDRTGRRVADLATPVAGRPVRLPAA